MSTNAERIRKYKAKMQTEGFKRLSVYVHPDLVALLKHERQPHECTGRILERLLLGKAMDRPDY
jgi:hypothetical protein